MQPQGEEDEEHRQAEQHTLIANSRYLNFSQLVYLVVFLLFDMLLGVLPRREAVLG